MQPVKGGGRSTPDGWLFELTGGRLCLDLANTIEGRERPQPKELLESYDDLLSWSEQAGVLAPGEVRRLRRLAARNPRQARSVLERARRVREAIYGIFSAVAAGRAPSAPALDALNDALPEALRRLRVVHSGAKYGWGWDGGEEALDRMLWPVVRSAADLLTSEERERVRECAAETCAWLFLDESRNRSRRWCDMSVCGNRDKARRHYRRHKVGR
jgi:predicted RNA-binding Zn ribbon-like protein